MARKRKKISFNGQVIRDWLNVAAAVGALLVGVVSFWSTARISGLEDYLRSEIGRRNSELDALTVRNERAQTLAEKRSEALANLQFSADALSASFAMTQARLEQAKGALGGLQAQVDASRDQLSDLDRRLSSQSERLDLLNRRRVYQNLSLGSQFRFVEDDDDTNLGETMYNFIVNSAAGRDENDLIPYYEQLRKAATYTCRPLKSFAPRMLQQKQYPEYPRPPGKRVKDNPLVRLMTADESKAWESAQADFSNQWQAVSQANRRALDYNLALKRYVVDNARQCACAALATQDRPAAAICPDLKVSEMPKLPSEG